MRRVFFLTELKSAGFGLFLFLVNDIPNTQGFVAEAFVFVVLLSRLFFCDFFKFDNDCMILLYIFVKQNLCNINHYVNQTDKSIKLFQQMKRILILQSQKKVFLIVLRQSISLQQREKGKIIQFPTQFQNLVQQNCCRIIDMNKEAQIKQKILKIFTSEDLFHKAFLRPLQVILRTKSVDPGYYTKYDNGLPQGMMIAEKQRGDMRQNIYTPTVINPVPDDYVTKYSYEDLQANNEDNLISLLKKQKGGIELAICVCMYSQDKKMLKTTLAGIGQNIDRLVAHGMDPDKIAVIVVMDGIEHVHPTVVEYFEDLQRQSEIYLTEDAPELNEILEQNDESKQLDEEDSQLKKRNYFLFDIEELKQRRINRFSARKAEFHEIKTLKSEIDDLLMKKNALTYESLNKRLQQFYIKKAKQQKKQDFGLDENQVNQLSEQALVQEYANNLTRSRAIIDSALREAKRYCNEYIASRDHLAYVNAFRTGVFLQQEVKNQYSQVPIINEVEPKKQKKKDKEKQGYNALDEEEELKKIKMNLFLCVKYKNSGKLSSHNWFFNGFCHKEILCPKYAILLDTGLRPQNSAIYKMYHYMKKHPDVGGVCGYMKLKLEKAEQHQVPEDEDVDWVTQQFHRFADIQRAQQIEYHLAHLIDKPFESIFKFIHVLPGAFSGYNMKALIPQTKQSDDPKKNNEQQSARLLKNYFKGLDQKIKEEPPKATQFTVCRALSKVLLPDLIYNCCYPPDEKTQEGLLYNENINLAEDRILCLGIHQHNKSLAFLPDAEAYVDPIKSTHALFGQRKRWINGSFFAFEKVKRQIARGNRCQFCLHIQIAFLSFMNMLSFIAPGLFMFTVSVAMQAFRADVLTKFFADIIPYNSQIYNAFVLVINFLYAMLWFGFILYSIHMNNKNKKFISYIYATSTIMGIFSLIVMIVLSVDIIRGLIGDSSFTIENQAFIQEIPGGQITIDSLRYVILMIIGLYVVPIVVYGICFCTFSFACEVLFSVFAFFFYTPTYLILLNTYALCRIDDISWGTKGLDSHKATKKDDKIMETWTVIKFLYVAKLVFWNVVVAALLLHFGNSFKIRFFITFGIMFILAITLAIKVLLGVCYYCGYFCSKVRQSPIGNKRKVSHLLEEFNQFEVKIKRSIEEHLNIYLSQAKKMNLKSFDLGSIMMVPKNRTVSKIFQKKSAILAKDRSNIIRKQIPSNDFMDDNVPSSHGLNQKQSNEQLNEDLNKKDQPKTKKFKKAAFF